MSYPHQRELNEGLLSDDRPQRWLVALNAVPGLMASLIRVPAAYWQQEFEGDDGKVHLARVKCPCGEQPLVEEGEKRDCACARAYIYLGRDKLYVANSPKSHPKPRWEQIVDDWRTP